MLFRIGSNGGKPINRYFRYKLAAWCARMRHKFNKNELKPKWIEKLDAIGFNYDKHLEHWKINFNEVKDYIIIHESLNGISLRLRNWCLSQYHTFIDADPGLKKVILLDSIDFFKHVHINDTWEEMYEQLKDFINLHHKKPTFKTNKKLNSWLSNQRVANVKRELPKKKLELLQMIGIDIESKQEDFEVIWNRQYDAVITFLKNNNGRWPFSYQQGHERKLYIWCQSQRQNRTMMLKGLQIENKDHTAKLNKIGFIWDKTQYLKDQWETKLCRLSETIKLNNGEVPQMIAGKQNPVYTWYIRQKRLIRENKMSEVRKARFLAAL